MIRHPSTRQHGDLSKPPRGEQRLEQRGHRRANKTAEDKAMADAKRRDGNKCRWPRCRYKDLHVGCAHLEHRKMGGNPTGDKTERHKLIALCVRHHDQFDGRVFPDTDIRPVNAEKGTDGPCEYYMRNETGEMAHIATEKYIGVSEARR